MNDLAKTPQPQQSAGSSAGASALTLELAKMLVIVAPVTMTTEQREIWLRGAVDALEGIQAHEVAAISAELRRSVTRHNQIVPEIARLVAEKRSRSVKVEREVSPWAAEMNINREAEARRKAARGRDEIEAAWAWERQARIDAGLVVRPLQKPLTTAELDNMPSHMVALGLKLGFLRREHGKLVEA